MKTITVACNHRDHKAVEPLIQALKDEDGAVRALAAEALGKLGDQKAVEPLIQAMKAERVPLAVAEALGELGDPRAVEPLIQAMKDGRGFHYTKALGKLGVKTTAEAVVDNLLSKVPNSKLQEDEVAAFRNLFGNYTNLILGAGRYSYSKKILGSHDPLTYHIYKLDLYSVETLCKIDSPISSNILHRLSKIKDRKVIGQTNYMGDIDEILNLEPIRSLAEKELKKRGNPPYDPSAYLDNDAWNISTSPKRTTPRSPSEKQDSDDEEWTEEKQQELQRTLNKLAKHFEKQSRR